MNKNHIILLLIAGALSLIICLGIASVAIYGSVQTIHVIKHPIINKNCSHHHTYDARIKSINPIWNTNDSNVFFEVYKPGESLPFLRGYTLKVNNDIIDQYHMREHLANDTAMSIYKRCDPNCERYGMENTCLRYFLTKQKQQHSKLAYGFLTAGLCILTCIMIIVGIVIMGSMFCCIMKVRREEKKRINDLLDDKMWNL